MSLKKKKLDDNEIPKNVSGEKRVKNLPQTALAESNRAENAE